MNNRVFFVSSVGLLLKVAEPAALSVVQMGERNMACPAIRLRGGIVSRVAGKYRSHIVSRSADVAYTAVLVNRQRKVAAHAVTIQGRAERGSMRSWTRGAVASITRILVVANETPGAVDSSHQTVASAPPEVVVGARWIGLMAIVAARIHVTEITSISGPEAPFPGSKAMLQRPCGTVCSRLDILPDLPVANCAILATAPFAYMAILARVHVHLHGRPEGRGVGHILVAFAAAFLAVPGVESVIEDDLLVLPACVDPSGSVSREELRKERLVALRVVAVGAFLAGRKGTKAVICHFPVTVEAFHVFHVNVMGKRTQLDTVPETVQNQFAADNRHGREKDDGH